MRKKIKKKLYLNQELEVGDIVHAPCSIAKVIEILYEDGNKRRRVICQDLVILSLRYLQEKDELQKCFFFTTDCKKIRLSQQKRIIKKFTYEK